MNKNKQVLFGVVAAVAVLCVVVALVVNRGGGEKESDVIKIGVLLNLTGDMSQADVPKRTALEIGLKYLQSKSNDPEDISHKFRLFFEDMQSDAKNAPALFHKLHSAGVKIMITSSSISAMGIQSLAEENGVLHFGMSGLPEFGKNNRLSFRITPTVETSTQAMLRLLKQLGNPRIYIVHAEDPFFEAYATILRSEYGNVESVDTFKIAQIDFTNIITKLQHTRAQHVVILGYGIGEKHLYNQMLSRRILVPVIGSEVFYYTVADLPSVENDAEISKFYESTYFLGPKMLSDIVSVVPNSFAQYYSSMIPNEEPRMYGAFAADTLTLLRWAYIKNNENFDNIDSICARIASLGDVEVFSGSISVSPNREIKHVLEYFSLDSRGKTVSVTIDEIDKRDHNHNR